MKYTGSLTLLLLLLLPIFSYSQNKETVHLHTDKDIYIPGETIWFKAYIFQSNSPTAISTTLYAGVYSANGKLLNKKIYPLFEGSCSGDFQIPDSLNDEVLQLRVFTKNMFEADSNNAYRKLVKIYQENSVSSKEKTREDISLVKFYPEGGTLVAGIINHIGFRSWYSDGKPASISGVIKELSGNKIIDSIFTGSDGLGKFQLIPEFGKQYIVTWKAVNEKEQQLILQPAVLSSAGLHTDMGNGRLYYSIQKNNDLPRFNKMQLLLKSGTDTVYKETILLNNNRQFVNSFKTDSFPPGIFELYLIDDNSFILQQKTINISRNKNPVQINIIEKDLSAKGKTILEITLQDTIIYNLSLSVADTGFYDQALRRSIYDELLLGNYKEKSADIGPYLIKGDEKKTDLVLNTNEQKTVRSYNNVFDDYLSIGVKYSDKKYALPKRSVLTLMLNDKGSGKQFFKLLPSSQVSFDTSGLIFYDSAKVYFQLEQNKELSDRLSIVKPAENNMPFQISAVDFKYDILNKKSNAETLKIYSSANPTKFNDIKTIQEVIVKTKYVNPVTKRSQELDKKYTSGMFSGLARGQQLNVIDDPTAERYFDVYNYIGSRLGLQSAGPFGSRTLTNPRRGTPLLFIDETEAEPKMLETVSLSQVAYVKYITGIVSGSSFVSDAGALYVYLKKGNDITVSPTNMKIAWVKGYDISKEFEVPDYSEKSSLASKDYRTTLYWNPFIISDRKTKKIRVTYYNNDIATRHLIILKGVGNDGSIVEITTMIE
ncbi:MAG: hypothetical protein WKF35_01055 [Ferruginibacter sp.]